MEKHRLEQLDLVGLGRYPNLNAVHGAYSGRTLTQNSTDWI
jgi:hypothetical protein